MRYTIKEERFREFASSIRPYSNQVRGKSFTLVTAAYATMLKQGWEPASGEVDEGVRDFVSHVIPMGSPFDDALPVRQFSDCELAAIVMSNDWDDGRNGQFTSSDPVARLASTVLGIEPRHHVADLFCGMGSFMRIAVGEYGVRRFYGRDRDFDSTVIAKMRASLLDGEMTIETKSIASGIDGAFDRIFLDGPLGVRALGEERELLAASAGKVAGDVSVRSTEWLFALRAMASLAPEGKLATVIGGGPLFNKSDEALRKALLMGGKVESVIALPERVLPGTGIAPFVVILSSGNSTVRLVDATDLGERERRFTTLAQADIDEIVARTKNAGDRAADIDVAELSANEWVLDPKRYVSRVEVPDSVPLGSLVKFIGRGANISARELDARITDEKTPYRYLMIKDVEDGEIRGDLPYLTEINDAELRFCLQDGDIVLGKMKPFKSARVRLKEGEAILCTGNLFVIRPDADEIDPTCLALFLSSDLAISQLRSLCSGTTIPSVPINALKALQVPYLSMDVQRRVAQEYEALKQEISMHQLRIERAKDRMASLFVEGTVIQRASSFR